MSEERIKKMKIYTYRYAIENFESKKFEKKLINLYENKI